MDSKLKVPRALKAKLMLWSDISHHDMELIDQMQSIPDLESALFSVLEVDLPEPRRAVLLELLAQAVLFCRDHGFKKEQTSALLSIIKFIHEANTETPLNNRSVSEYSRELLLFHSVSVNMDLSLAYSEMEEHESPASEGSSEPGPSADVKHVEKEAEPMTNESSEAQEASTTEQMGISTVSVLLKEMIEREVSKQMEFVTKRLTEHIRELASQRDCTPDSSSQNNTRHQDSKCILG